MILEEEQARGSFQKILEKMFINSSSNIKEFQKKAWEKFIELGLPTKKTESYRSVKLASLFSATYETEILQKVDETCVSELIYEECQNSTFVFVNGYFAPALSRLKGLPSKIVISSLQPNQASYSAFLNHQNQRFLKEETDSFAVLNRALHREGEFIYFPPELKNLPSIQFLHIISSQKSYPFLIPKFTILVGKNSEVNLFFSQKNISGSSRYFVNQVTDLTLEEGSKVNLMTILLEEGQEGWHLESLRADLKKRAYLNTVLVTKGSEGVRGDYKINLIEEGAQAFLNGLWSLKEKRKAHFNVFMNHEAPNCFSYQLFKGILNNSSQSSFNGEIFIQRDAQESNAFQLNKHLLLDKKARAVSQPQLKVHADSVKASHGATFGQISEEELFYMKTRGFSEEKAKALLIKSFYQDILEKIPLKEVKDIIESQLFT